MERAKLSAGINQGSATYSQQNYRLTNKLGAGLLAAFFSYVVALLACLFY